MEKVKKDDEEGGWMHISDMMSTLMIIFLFISVCYMIDVRKDRDRMKDIAVAYNRLQNELYVDLSREFKDDLGKWNAVLDKKDMSIRFKEPDVLFDVGSSYLKMEFKDILDDFFPRYIKILNSDKYRDNIEEIRIEGHTSTEWSSSADEDDSYIYNMELSQGRTREVLTYCLSLMDGDKKSWTKYRLTSNGLSSSRILLDKDGNEDKVLSRRVEFKVRTNSVDIINEIIGDGEVD